MVADGEHDTVVLALAPLRWSLVKIKREWDGRISRLDVDASEKLREIGHNHLEQRRALAQRQRTVRDAVKANIPLNSRLTTIRASKDNLIRLGRVEEAEKVQRKLKPLEQGFWAKALASSGFTEQAKREKEELLGAQQIELASLGQALRRDSDRARQARDAEVKAQQRKNRCSSDGVWSIWCAAKSGETKRLVHLLALSKADVDARDPDSGWTALHFASRQGKLGAVEVLVEHKAFVGARGPDGRTPLHLAAGWGTYEVCFSLLRSGADKNVLDRDGKTAQHLAHSKKRYKITAVLDGWKPMGLTATQTQKIIESRGEGPPSPWEIEADPEIRAQLRLLDLKTATFGESHPGIGVTLSKLGGLCREAGRLKDSKQHLERLVELLQTPKTAGDGSKNRSARRSLSSTPPSDLGTLVMALGNLGVVCHELREADRASEMLEASLQSASFVAAGAASQDANGRHLFETATRNLGLHLLSEGRVNEARPVLRAYLNTYEESVRSDMPGGDEGIHLIPRLTLLSYADMLAGDHAAASAGAERAQMIAAKCWRHSFPPAVPGVSVVMGGDPSDPIPRLEWMGVQRFAAGEHDAASKFFTRARVLVLQRKNDTNCSSETGRTVEDRFDRESGPHDGRNGRSSLGSSAGRSKDVRDGCMAVGTGNGAGTPSAGGADTGEFHPDAMRLDRCTAVAICRRGTEAF